MFHPSKKFRRFTKFLSARKLENTDRVVFVAFTLWDAPRAWTVLAQWDREIEQQGMLIYLLDKYNATRTRALLNVAEEKRTAL